MAANARATNFCFHVFLFPVNVDARTVMCFIGIYPCMASSLLFIDVETLHVLGL